MIDPKLFTVESIIAAVLEDTSGNRDPWKRLVEIVPDYVAPFDKENKKKCVVLIRHDYDNDVSFLRYSKGPAQGFFWDMYGDDFIVPELALLAIMSAPVPPWMLKHTVWGQIKKIKDAERDQSKF